jgi:hypothetical protein
MPDLGFFQFLIEVRHHPEDVFFSHDFVNPAIGTRALRRTAGWRINYSSHRNILREFAYRFDFSKSIPGISRGGNTVSEAPGGKDAITKITTFQNEQLAAITSKQKEAADLENRPRVQSRDLTEAARTQLTRNLETARTNIQTMGDEAQKKITEMQQQLIAPIEQKTAMAVRAYLRSTV